MRVLVVDDDSVFREELAELLRDDRHTVATVPSVAKALESLEHDEFDAVLSDLKMPRQSGLDLLREVRARWPRTFVVMITGFATVETALESMKLGAFDYVRKPFRIDQVRETLRLVAQEREFEAPTEAQRDPVREARALAEGGRMRCCSSENPARNPSPTFTSRRSTRRIRSGSSSAPRRSSPSSPRGPSCSRGWNGCSSTTGSRTSSPTSTGSARLLSGHGPLRVGFNPRRVASTVAAALGGAVSAEETHSTLEALSNPIRRKTLQRLAEAPSSFGEAMQAAGLDDSPKMAFHMRRLSEAGSSSTKRRPTGSRPG